MPEANRAGAPTACDTPLSPCSEPGREVAVCGQHPLDPGGGQAPAGEGLAWWEAGVAPGLPPQRWVLLATPRLVGVSPETVPTTCETAEVAASLTSQGAAAAASPRRPLDREAQGLSKGALGSGVATRVS